MNTDERRCPNCGHILMPNNWIAVCCVNREIGCMYCMIFIGLSYAKRLMLINAIRPSGPPIGPRRSAILNLKGVQTGRISSKKSNLSERDKSVTRRWPSLMGKTEWKIPG